MHPTAARASSVLLGAVLVTILGAQRPADPIEADTDSDALFRDATRRAQEGDVDQALVRLRESFGAGHPRPSQALAEPGLSALTGQPGPRRALRALLMEFAREWQVTMVTPLEPGDPLIVSGTVVDQSGRPIEEALVYVHHTDAQGIYSDAGNGDPRLFAFMRTDRGGRYKYRTIRPAKYPDSDVDQHVHYRVSAAGFEDRDDRLGFADDPRWIDRAAPSWARPVTRGPDGIDRCVHDIVLTALPGAPVTATAPAERIDFVAHVRPIVDPRCGPCHFEGGKMYDELPFDRPQTFAILGDKLFTRIQDEAEQATIRAFLRQIDSGTEGE